MKAFILNFIKYIFVSFVWIVTSLRRIFRRPSKIELQGARCLVVSLSGIGNGIMCTPLIQALKENDADEVDVIVPSKVHGLIFSGIEYCDDVVVIENSWRKRCQQFRELRKKNYNLLLYTFPTAEIGFTLMGLVIKPKLMILHDFSPFHSFFKFIRKTADHVVPFENNIHDVEQNLNLLNPIADIDFRFNFYPEYKASHRAKTAADEWLLEKKITGSDTLCFMHPGCTRGADFKRWPVQSFVDLGDKLLDLNVKIVVILGPDESEYRSHFERPNFFILDSVDFEVTLALLSRARLLVSNDSGLMHAAALLKVPVVTIWGGTDVGRNGARGTSAVNIVNSNVPCRPCARILPNVNCPNIEFECIRSISVQHVYNSIVDSHFLGWRISDLTVL